MLTGHDIQFVCREVVTVCSTSPRCLVVYPLGKKSKQRVGVTAKNGTMSVFSIGKGTERVAVFDTAPQSKPVSCATLYEDQLFFVYGSTLDAYSRKGRRFFSFDTNVTEVIHTLFVSTPFIICCGSFMATGFREANELGFYMAPDRINAMVSCVSAAAVNVAERSFDDYRCILGCNDRTIRMLQGHKSIEEVHCEASVTSLGISEGTRRVYYGTGAGSLGCLELKDRDTSLSRVFSLIPEERQAAVTALAVYDINLDEKEELLVGHQDGTVQIFYIHVEEGIDRSYPICIWSGSTDESVLSIAAGFITHACRPDMLVHSFSGTVTAFTLQVMDRIAPEEAASDNAGLEIAAAQISEVSRDIDALKKSIVTQTQELARCSGVTKNGTPLLAVSSTFKTKVTLSQQKDDPALRLLVEVDTPLDCVVLQSEVQLHFLDKDSAEVIVQEAIPRNNPSMKSLAIVRPLETRRYSCSVTFWVEDGHWGMVSVTALAVPAPRTAQVKMVQLRPLPLYERVGKVDEVMTGEEGPAALSTMEVQGKFSARDMHSWIFKLLPGTPEIYQEKMSSLSYEDTFFHHKLGVKYGDRYALFTTGSLQTLAVTKRFISYCASERSIEVDFTVNVHGKAVRFNLSRIVPCITACNTGLQSLRLLEALQELQGDQQTAVTCFPKEHQQLLEKADAVKKAHPQAVFTMGYLQSSLLSLYGSVVEFVPTTPKMSSATKEALLAAACHGTASEITSELERLFLCDDESVAQ
ncbi:putative intergrin alpha chain protein [Trypanosoma rangeli]|uniref:Putative intergrin alpha chain protein n=1 Tax=Trypanosoma rangeli TaxID=5698 RepID=A0A422NRV6_TRYRA|nr:putative intergrin alpha chain protein [Trypanosoma rangeli]RNF08144.1 putative intergrin alpha chain protein [Trypanosoma rangeli]|eukprot:RNF08144.1 putative intergrin alpha chain protein [Trypanosoma rangeli]